MCQSNKRRFVECPGEALPISAVLVHIDLSQFSQVACRARIWAGLGFFESWSGRAVDYASAVGIHLTKKSGTLVSFRVIEHDYPETTSILRLMPTLI